MACLLKQSTAVDIALGPFVDSTDGVTAETALTLSQADIRLKKNNGAWAQASDNTSATHEENGWYEKELDATDTDTLGILIVAVNESGALPVWREFQVVPAAVYDALVSGSGNGVRSDVQAIANNAITAASIAADAITAAKIADGAIDAGALAADCITAAKIADGAIDAGALAADCITAAKLAADVTTELQSGLATAAALDAVDNFVDTEVAAIKTVVDAIQAKTDNLPSDPADASVVAGLIAGVDAKVDTIDTNVDSILEDTGTTLQGELDGIQADTEDIQSKIGTPAGASVSADIAAIEAQTDDIGAAGAGLTAVPWNAAWDAEVQSEATDALNAYDPPTRAEVTADKDEIIAYLNGLVIAKGTIGATGNSTTVLHLTGLTYGDDEINNYLIAIKDVSTGEWHARYIEDWADTGDLATVATLPFTPENSVDLYAILAFRQDVTGGSGLDAAGVRAAVGLASANLDTQLSTIDNFLDTEVQAIKDKTDNLPSDPADASVVAGLIAAVETKVDTVDTVVDAIKAKTDSLTFTQAGHVDANVQRINDVTITGDGQTGTEFGV